MRRTSVSVRKRRPRRVAGGKGGSAIPSLESQAARRPVRLSQTWLFASVPPDELAELERSSRERVYMPGEVVYRAGEPSDGLFLVFSGAVRIVAHAEDGERMLASVGAGECFGEMGVIDGEPRSATAVSASLASLCWVPTEPFLDVLERVPLVSMKLLALLSQRLRDANHLTSDLPAGARAQAEPLEV